MLAGSLSTVVLLLWLAVGDASAGQTEEELQPTANTPGNELFSFFDRLITPYRYIVNSYQISNTIRLYMIYIINFYIEPNLM